MVCVGAFSAYKKPDIFKNSQLNRIPSFILFITVTIGGLFVHYGFLIAGFFFLVIACYFLGFVVMGTFYMPETNEEPTKAEESEGQGDKTLDERIEALKKRNEPRR